MNKTIIIMLMAVIAIQCYTHKNMRPAYMANKQDIHWLCGG